MSEFETGTTSTDAATAAPADDVEQHRAAGRALRRTVPRSALAEWTPTDRDPVALLAEQNDDRLPWLVPLRHLRMSASPFTFYRGSARLMARDLGSTANTGLHVQLGGDAHLSNFGAYASPERQLVFDANDFDETLPGPWEWDLRRLATSFTIAAQHLGFDAATAREVTARSAEAYRRSMHRFAELGHLELWRQYVSASDVRDAGGWDRKELARRLTTFEERARRRTSLQARNKFAERVDGRWQIRSEPPVLQPFRDLPDEFDPDVIERGVHASLDAYRETLQDDRRHLFDRYRMVDIGIKVVGVGSVGTRCFIALFLGRDEDDPLMLQIKESGASELSFHLGESAYAHQGQRVVEGQRLTQAQSDTFLGWTTGMEGREFYLRQLRDWKGSVEIEGSTANQLGFYAQLCGMTLARGHARSGDATAIAAYLGNGDRADRAVVEFATSYARQNDADYAAFREAISDGRLECSAPEMDPKTAGATKK